MPNLPWYTAHPQLCWPLLTLPTMPPGMSWVWLILESMLFSESHQVWAHKVAAISIWPLGADFCSYWVRQWRLRCTPLGIEVHMAIRLEVLCFGSKDLPPCRGPVVHQHAHSSKGWSCALTTRLSQNSWILRATLNLSLLTPSIHKSRGTRLLKKCVHCYRGRWEWEPKVTERWGQLRSKVNGEAQICKTKPKWEYKSKRRKGEREILCSVYKKVVVLSLIIWLWLAFAVVVSAFETES